MTDSATHTGLQIGSDGVDIHGLEEVTAVHWNHRASTLYEMALARNEGQVAENGPLVVTTGQHTGRSAKDKFIVQDSETTDSVWWDNNKSITPDHFETLHRDMLDHARGREIFVQELFGGADPDNRLAIRVYTEYAWHSLFIRNLLITPEEASCPEFNTSDMMILDLPSFKASPERHGIRTETVIACDFTRKIVLIGGTSYAGEIKKSVFSVLNYCLPPRGVMPMHCSINVGKQKDSAIFFGLSGTGKTTLSADPNRVLIGDDEHGWSENGVFNFEGGCYAKMIRLDPEAEPEIYATTQRFGTVLENVVMDPRTRVLNLDDASLTENSRGAYPLSFIPNASDAGQAGHPKTIIMLAADAFGVFPPIAHLTPAQAMYHFLSGYTAKIAGTEKGVTEPEATFSTCFGAPFMPRHPCEYGKLLKDLIARHGVSCWLVNTGWTGGAYGVGRRMPIKVTRALLAAALDGSLNDAPMRTDPNFGFEVPEAVPGVDAKILDPRTSWSDVTAYDHQAARLVSMFIDNFEQFAGDVDSDISDAAPAPAQAAE
ncbi:MAG: phosphoenolpyruvate carboxykinase [Parvularculales bacterium]